MGKIVKLKDITSTPDPEKDVYNSYNWYREYAQKYGYIPIGDTHVSVRKEKGSWVVDLDDFDHAVRSFINKKAEKEKHTHLMMDDHQKGIFHKGRISISDSRYYDNKGDFRLEVDTYSMARKDSDGTWYCNTCNIPAETEHNNPECHTCSDWGSCGRDCTLSKVYCSRCEKFLFIKGF